MTTTELDYAEKRMRQKWYDLVMAEQQGATRPVLERMYNAYILAVEEYNRCSSTASTESPGSAEQAAARSVHNEKQRRKAS